MILVSIIITLAYLFLIGSFVYGFDQVKAFKLEDMPSKTTFSVIIPFRNEAENLPDLLKSIETLNYPRHLFEIILVDDESDDHSVEVIKKNLHASSIKIGITPTDISIVSNKRKTNSPKKDAITTAIQKVKNEWVITTDADCILPKYWLDSFDECIQKNNSACIVAPVTYDFENTILGKFQLLDILSLQAATMGGFGIKKPFLCNGANFAYKKALFIQLKGFEGNTNIASGDDIFLLEKIIKSFPEQIYYLKCELAIVKTKSQTSWKHLISQRIRWAAKTSAYNNWFGKFTGLIILLMNGLLISVSLLSIIGVFKVKTLLYILIIKFNIDFYLIYKSASFFNQKESLISFMFAFIIYPFFSVYVAFMSLFTEYKWKGRSFKK